MSIPSPNGPLVDCISSKTIKNANQAVVEASSKPPKARGTYHHVDAEMQVKIALYACKCGNKAAMEHFTCQLCFNVKHSSVSKWEMKYLAEVKRRAKIGESAVVKCLPVKKRGRLLLIGEKLNGKVKAYIRAIRDIGGVVTTTITIAAGKAIVSTVDRSLLIENGAPATLSKNWAKSLLYKLNFVKKRGSSTAKVTVQNYEE